MILAIVIALISCSEETPIENQENLGPPEIGKTAPDFSGNTLDGNKISLKDYRGKVVFVEFWATWCGPCVAKMPEMIELYNDYKNEDFVFLGVSLDYSEGPLRSYVSENDIEWEQILDISRSISNLYEIPGTPHGILLDKEGKIIYKGYPRNYELRLLIDKSI